MRGTLLEGQTETQLRPAGTTVPAAPPPRSAQARSRPKASAPGGAGGLTEETQTGAAGRSPDLAAVTEVRTFAVAILSRTLEVLDGRRPRSQLAGAVAEQVLAQVSALLRHGALGTAGDCAKLHRVHVQFRSPQRAEVFGTIQCRGRVRALAGRLERSKPRDRAAGGPSRQASRWVLTEFTIL
ncbi:Rv3235 family protein [Gordonia hirsuta]|nr:Rv3235 family protein [Gordonia hirsuta]